MLHVGMKCNSDDMVRAQIYLSIISAKYALVRSSHIRGVYLLIENGPTLVDHCQQVTLTTELHTAQLKMVQ